jgi:hypothetical protein
VASWSLAEDHAIGHGQPRVEAQAGGGQGQPHVEIDDRALLHDGDRAQRVALVPLLEHALEHLVDRRRLHGASADRLPVCRRCYRFDGQIPLPVMVG